MRQIVAITTAAMLAVTPVAAEDKTEEGLSLMERGARLLLQGVLQEMEPAIEDLRKFSEEVEPGLRLFVEDMGPALAELMRKVDDFTAYHPPELMPNGDIIMRRKTPLEIERDKSQEGDEVDL